MDNPEVLSMYKRAMKELCELCEIDYVYLHTNDCGAGICWSEGLYSGPNGPEHCKGIPLSTRIVNYFRTFREGAALAGRDIYIETNSKIGVKEADSGMENLWPTLDDKTAVNFKTNKGTPLTSVIDLNYEFTVAPIRNIPMAITLIEQLEKAYHEDSEILRVIMVDQDFDLQYKIIKAFNSSPTNSLASRFALLEKVANEIVQDGKELVNVWWRIYLGLNHLYSTLMEGFTWISVNQRVLNRPFVLFPDELKPEEYNYFRKFQFQAQDDKAANDLLNNQGSGFVKGYYATFIAMKALDKANNEFSLAQKSYVKLMDNTEAKLKTQLKLAYDRIELLKCFVNNYKNAMEFQNIVDETDFTQTPELTLRWPQNPDPKLLSFERINRNEVDNTFKIISLIENREREMLVLAPSVELEDIFWLTTEITNQLKLKANIMLDHHLDGKKIYISGNK